MSATAFQRMRREQEAKKLMKIDKVPVEVKTQPGATVLTNKEMMALLDAKGIEYPKKVNKEILTKLLEGAE